MPNTRIFNTVPHTRVSNVVPNTRTSSFQTSSMGTPITFGTPIGLLLSLTYSKSFTPSIFLKERPNTRIKSN